MLTLLLTTALAVTPVTVQADTATSSAQTASEPQESQLDKALDAITSGRSNDAISLLDPLLDDFAGQYAEEDRLIFCGMNQTETLVYLAEAAADPQQRDRVAIAPDWCYALWAKGFALIDLKRLDNAIPYLERAVDMAPMHSHFLSELGFAYQQQKNWDAAYEAYERAAGFADLSDARDRELARAWRGMGFVHSEQGKWDEAEAMYRKCLNLDPDDEKAKSELQWIADNRDDGN